MLSIIRDIAYVNAKQIRRLVTHEDGEFFHAHKVFGVMSLGNYIYRLASQAIFGTMFFDTSYWTLASIFVHAMMHVTSFQFLIPSRRNRVYNIIWPEMRWHSLVFAYRSLLMMCVLWSAWIGMIPTYVTPWIRGPLVLATMALADSITSYYILMDAITETDTTMRTNPYPSYISTAFARMYNLMYSTSQVFGTMNILCRDMGSIFLIILPIQIAPFGMTLVKKGIITQAGWHLWYSLAIFANYWYATTMKRSDIAGLETFYITGMLFFTTGRFIFHKNKYALWGTIIAMQWYLFLQRPEFFAAIEAHAVP